MAIAREVKRRIRSVENTAQITRTMEMVATSKLKRASDRVQAPAQTAASSNAGFFTGDAGVAWHGKFDTVTAGVERRVDWQGAQVTTSADELESCDQEVRGRFRALERRIPVRREQ